MKRKYNAYFLSTLVDERKKLGPRALGYNKKRRWGASLLPPRFYLRLQVASLQGRWCWLSF